MWRGAAPTSRARRSSSNGSSDRAGEHLRRREVYVFDGYVGAEPAYRMPIRVVARTTWHALFAHTLFVRPSRWSSRASPRASPSSSAASCRRERRRGHEAWVRRRTEADDGPPSPVFVGISFKRRLVLILGTMYGGEMKKALFRS